MVKSSLNAMNIVSGMVYSTKVECSSVESLIRYINPFFENVSSEKAEVCKKMDELISKLNETTTRRINEYVKNQLIVQDLSRVRKLLQETHVSNTIESSLNKDFEKYISLLQKYDIKIPSSNLQIGESFPPPYKKIDNWALTFDTYDQVKFGLQRGVYFIRRYLMPNVSSLTLAHEMIHIAIGTKETHHLARGLEEGLADFASLILARETMGLDVAEDILFNMKFDFLQEQKWSVYRDAFRQMFIVYSLYGLDGIFEIIRVGQQKGRKYIKEIEASFLAGTYENIGVQHGSTEEKISQLFYRFLSYPYHIVVSPLARWLAAKISVGCSIERVIKDYNIPYHEGKKALQELQDRVFLVLIDDDTIVSDETKMYIQKGLLRYEV
jgi:hypothetical protein